MDGSFSRCAPGRRITGRRGAFGHSSHSGVGATIRALVGMLVGAVAALTTGCAPPPNCGPGDSRPVLRAELFFGRAMTGRGDVTDREWRSFVDQVVVPAFPAGFTALDADGGWMSPASHVVVRERSKLLIVALADTADSLAAIETVRQAYQRAFHQQLVGLITQHACGSF